MNPPPLPKSKDGLIVTSGNEVSGQFVDEYLGIVRGIVVRSPGISRAFTGGLRALSSGNIPEFSAVCEEARRDAYELMVQHARHLGADAVVGFRYDATEFGQNLTEVLAYGTAVKLAVVASGDQA